MSFRNLIILLLINLVKSDSTKYPESKQDWRIIFYTGSKVWAGTDSEIFVELNGELGNSQIIRIKPKKYQMEADSVDMFSLGDLDGKNIGNLKSIVVGKQHSYSFFNDWQLIKVEVIDPFGRKYIFNCNCWLTTLKYKRIIYLTQIEGDGFSLDDDQEHGNYTSRNTKVFPATIGILLILLILIIFTYFGNEICKKWRENIIYLTNSRASGSSEAQVASLSPRAGRRNVYRNVDNSANILLNTDINLNSTIEDKPPEYKDLFPINNNNQSNNNSNNNNNNINNVNNNEINESQTTQSTNVENVNTSQSKNTIV